MKALHRKLRSTRGESLVEAMAAILIFTFASLILFSMVTTASEINMTTDKADAALQAELLAAETQDAEQAIDGRVTVSVSADGATQSQELAVSFYYAEPGGLYTFSAER